MGFDGAAHIKAFFRDRGGITADDTVVTKTTHAITDASYEFVRIIMLCNTTDEQLSHLNNALMTFGDAVDDNVPLTAMVVVCIDGIAPHNKHSERERRESAGLSNEQKKKYPVALQPWRMGSDEYIAQFNDLMQELVEERKAKRDFTKPPTEMDLNPFRLTMASLMRTRGYKGTCVRLLSKGILGSIRNTKMHCTRTVHIIGLRYTNPDEDRPFETAYDPRFKMTDVDRLVDGGYSMVEANRILQLLKPCHIRINEAFELMLRPVWTRVAAEAPGLCEMRCVDSIACQYEYGMERIFTSNPDGGWSNECEYPGEGETRMISVIRKLTDEYVSSGKLKPLRILCITPDSDFILSSLIFYQNNAEIRGDPMWSLTISLGKGGKNGCVDQEGVPQREYMDVGKCYDILREYFGGKGMWPAHQYASLFTSMVSLSKSDYQIGIPGCALQTIMTHMDAYGWTLFFLSFSTGDPGKYNYRNPCFFDEPDKFIRHWTMILRLVQTITLRCNWASLSAAQRTNGSKTSPATRLRNDVLEVAAAAQKGDEIRWTLMQLSNHVDKSKLKMTAEELRSHIGRMFFSVEYYSFYGLGTFMPNLAGQVNANGDAFDYGYEPISTPYGQRYVPSNVPEKPERAPKRDNNAMTDDTGRE